MKRVALLLILAALLVGCSEVRQVQAIDGREVDLSPVWTFHAGSMSYNVYEFTDLERGQHCYVVVQLQDYYSGVALSCESVGGR